jgi:hypothetical protein
MSKKPAAAASEVSSQNRRQLSPKAAQNRREFDVQRSRERYAKGSDIGEIPPVKNPKRRKKAEKSFEFFAVTYFPHSTGSWPMSPDHERSNTRLQDVAENGGRTVEAWPRGSGKTTRFEVWVIWCQVTGRRKYAALFGSDAGKASLSIESIKMELSENDILYEDFPEVCHAIRALEGRPQRCGSQAYKGERTHIDWTAETIVLPKIPGSKASGAIISCHGITAASRGLRYKRSDGTQARPDLVGLDDIQTDESASTPGQVQKRMRIIKKNILKLGGHGKTLAVVCNATVIAKGDVIDQLLSDPAWQGVRIKAIRKWADRHEDMWLGEYKRLRQTYDKDIDGDQLRAWRAATEYYRENRAAMDAGCEVYWEHCYDREQEISAIQHFYNALIDDGPEVFASEFQQEPMESDETSSALKPEELVSRAIAVPRGSVPSGASTLTAFIDVQGKVLYWGVIAVGNGLRGHIVDYGCYPKQPMPYFTLRDVTVTLQQVHGTDDQAAAIMAGLEALVPQIMGRKFESEVSDATLDVSLLTIDANWRQYSSVVRDFCRRSKYGSRVMPSHGQHVGAARQSFSEVKTKPGERCGQGWKTETAERQKALAHDSNFWKSLVATRLRLPTGDPLAFTFCAGNHSMLIDHITAEYPQTIENKNTGKRIEQWNQIPGRDNHWLDCIVGAMVGASFLGISAVGAESAPPPRRVAVSAEEARRRREEIMRRFG